MWTSEFESSSCSPTPLDFSDLCAVGSLPVFLNLDPSESWCFCVYVYVFACVCGMDGTDGNPNGSCSWPLTLRAPPLWNRLTQTHTDISIRGGGESRYSIVLWYFAWRYSINKHIPRIDLNRLSLSEVYLIRTTTKLTKFSFGVEKS